jgi:hypothetical protein
VPGDDGCDLIRKVRAREAGRGGQIQPEDLAAAVAALAGHTDGILVRENLKPGGAFVLEMVSKGRLARTFHPTTSTELPNGDVLFQRHEIADDWTRIRNHLTLIRAGAARTIEFTHRIYSGQEMKALLKSSGLVCVRVAVARRLAA